MDTGAHDHAAMMRERASSAGGEAGAAGDGFLSGLFEVFTPRRQCMNFEGDVVWMHIISDSMIALAYFSIPLALVQLMRKRKDLAFTWMFALFAAFILACGTTHVFGLVAIWHPMYRLDGVVKMATGLVSIATAILLWPLIAKAVLLPSPAQLRLVNEKLAAEVLDRQRAEDQVRQSNQQLDQRVQERTAQLHAADEQRTRLLQSEQAARAQAEKTSRLKDEFVATLSHELRTPINSILGWAQILRKDPAHPEAAYGLEVIERSSRAQVRLIEDLLDVSRIVAGKMRLEVREVDLAAVVRSAVEVVRPAAEAKDVTVACTLEPEARLVRGDGARLEQVAWNLLSNAIKFTPRHGRVDVVLMRRESFVDLVVRDTGKGIRPEFLPHVFDRFRQEDASTTRSHGGLGLGLSIVRHLVELHGGTVGVASEGEGKGATFIVSLPFAPLREGVVESEPGSSEALGEAPSALGEVGPRPLEGLRILAVDDESDGREMLRRVLMARGAEVVSAASSAEGLRMLQGASSPFHVLVADIGMPEEDGYTFVRKVRELPEGRGSPQSLPAIALTAYARSEDRVRALHAGFQAHLVKPAEPDELVATILRLTDWLSR